MVLTLKLLIHKYVKIGFNRKNKIPFKKVNQAPSVR